MRHRPHNRLPRTLRLTVYALTGLLLLSGAAWLIVSYALAPAGEPTPAPHALGGPLLAIHGIAAYAALAGCALVGHAHLRIGWRLPGMRTAGGALCGALLALALTGLGFYYSADEAARPWLRWTHVAVGVALPGLLALHIARGRRVAGRR